MARRAREQQARLATIRPQLEALQKKFANDPAALVRETRALHAKHDIKLFTPSSFVGFLVQMPLFSGLLSAVRKGLGSKVRFLWVADLARPDLTMILGVAALSAWGVALTPAAPGQPVNQTPMMLVSVGMTVFLLWSASAAVAVSWGAGSLVSVLQNWVLSRDARAATPGG
jgi:YidC/Oxa1 family membrane protein insertase